MVVLHRVERREGDEEEEEVGGCEEDGKGELCCVEGKVGLTLLLREG